jgi:hypothetical protein
MSIWNIFQTRYPANPATQAEVNALAPHAETLIKSFITYPYTDDDAPEINNAITDQIAAWIETGVSNDLAGYASNTSMSLGDLTISGQPAHISPRAVRVLRAAGLLQLIGD